MLKKGYINRRNFSIHISKKKIFIGGFLGVFISLFFYAFLKLMSKLLSVLDAQINNYELILLTESQKNFYSFFVAFIAVNFSFSIIFEFFTNTPKKFFEKNSIKRRSILGLQRVTNWGFLNWFCRIAFVFGLLAFSLESQFLLAEVEYVIYLIIIVFIGQMWMSLRPFLKHQKLKIFLVFITSILLLTFTLSKIEIIDNDAINKAILSNNRLYNYKIDRVTSRYYNKSPRDRSLYFNLYFKEVNNTIIVKADVNYSDSKSETLSEIIEFFKGRYPKALKPYFNYILHIDKDLKMKDVKQIHQILQNQGVQKIYYSLKDEQKPFYFRSKKFFENKLNDYKLEEIKSKPIKIEILDNGKFYYQNDSISKQELRTIIVDKIKHEGVSPFIITFNNNTSFKAYFEVISLTKNIINEFRDNYTQKGYQQEYNSLSENIKKEIKAKIYWVFIDDLKQ